MPRYDPSTALIVVDVQNDFADPSGGLPVPDGEAVVPVINREVERAVEAGAPVFYTQDWHPPVTPHFAKDGGIWPVHCVAGTWGAKLHPGLLVRGPVVHKGVSGEDGYSGFTTRHPETGATRPTGLHRDLVRAHVRSVVVCGLATDYCVKATALDARTLGYPTTLLVRAVRAVDLQPGDGARAIEEMRAAGVVIDEDGAADAPAV
jgi:nicotinamidase/pyrazinamidase